VTYVKTEPINSEIHTSEVINIDVYSYPGDGVRYTPTTGTPVFDSGFFNYNYVNVGALITIM
jgi:hypothetical protein